MIFAIAKFALGAWLIILIIPILVAAMLFIHRQYAAPPARGRTSGRRSSSGRRAAASASSSRSPRSRATSSRRSSSGGRCRDDVTAVHVTDDLERGRGAPRPVRATAPGIPFVIVESPYRQLVRPLVRYLEDAAAATGDDILVVLLPEYVARHWWEKYLYNENARRIREALLGRPEHPRRGRARIRRDLGPTPARG